MDHIADAPSGTQPHNTRWLSPAQRRLAQVRLAEDAGEADEDTSTDSYVPLRPLFTPAFLLVEVTGRWANKNRFSAFAGLVMALKDPKVPLFALMTCSQLLGLGFVNFFPTCVSP